MAITTTQFNNIVDDVAKILTDLETNFITNAAANAPTTTTINTGITASSNSLFARFNALSSGDQAGQMGIQMPKMMNAFTGYLSIAKASFYAIMAPYLEALDFDIGGVYAFMFANSLLVNPEFAAAFNAMATSGRTLGLRPNPIATIPPSMIFVATDQILGSIAVTGSAAGTFTAGTALDLTKYAPVQLYLKNTAGAPTTGTATSFTVTYTNAAGTTGQTSTQALGGALAAGAKLAINSITGSAVSNITVGSGGASSDAIAVVAAPVRSIAY